MKLNLFLVIPILVCISYSIFAQTGDIKGQVKDSGTSETLPYASIFINNTTFGTNAIEDGTFLLEKIPLGEYELIVSFSGYQSYKTKIIIRDTSTLSLSVRLTPIQLKTVDVVASRDKDWEKQLARFNKLFLGSFSKSEPVIIQNPWVLNFEEGEKGIFLAKSSEALEIDNFKLGYHISYQMSSFTATHEGYTILGNARFRELSTIDPTLIKKWNENRSRAYEGSYRHLFKSIINGKIHPSGFYLYSDLPLAQGGHTDIFFQNVGRTITEYNTTGTIDSGNYNGAYRLKMPRRLEVHYRNKTSPARLYKDVTNPVSSIEVSGGYLFLTKEGVVVNYPMMSLSGDMGELRIADLLPVDYDPGILPIQNESPSATKENNNEFWFLIEKTYLHTDRSYYYTNDRIYFKAYMNYSTPVLRDSLSRVLMVELIDPDNRIISVRQLLISNGNADGSFDIGPDFPRGNYAIRAYTRWMLNYDPDLIFYKPIRILGFNEAAREEQQTSESLTDTSLHILTDKEVYEPREKIIIQLQMNDTARLSLPANVSIAVTDIHQVVKPGNENSILNDFPISQIDTKKLPDRIAYALQDGMNLKGTFIAKNGKPGAGVINVLQKNTGETFVIPTAKTGEFNIEGLQFLDTVEFAIQGRGLKGEAGTIVIDTLHFSPPVRETDSLMLHIVVNKVPTVRRQWISSSSDNSQLLKEVTIEAKRIHDIPIAIKSMANYTITGDWLRSVKANNIPILLQGRIPGLNFYTVYDGMTMIQIVTLEGRHTSFFAGGVVLAESHNSFALAGVPTNTKSKDKSQIPLPREPLILIDGAQVNYQPGDGARMLNLLRADEIDRIEIYKSNGFTTHGVLGNSGVISIYRRNPMDYPSEENKFRARSIRVAGYSLSNDFESPDYSIKDATNAAPDYRATIYWNPNVKINDSNTTVLSLFAADNSTQYRIVVEGTTSNGIPVRGEKIIEVKTH